MNVKQGFVLVIGVMVAFWLIENPPMMPGITPTAEAVVDVQRLHYSLAVESLIGLLLLIVFMRKSVRVKSADIQLCPRCHELHPVGRPECADPRLPDAIGNSRSAYLLSEPVTQEYRRVGLNPRALLLPFAVVMALVLLLGCLLYADNLQSPSASPSDSRQSNLSQR